MRNVGGSPRELEPAPFGATIRRHRFLGVAGCRINRLSKRISLLMVAHRCSVLRSGWCQERCQTASLTTALFGVVAPRTSSGAATLFSIESAPRDYPRATTREKVLLLHLATGGPHMTRRSTPGTARARARSPCGWLNRGTQRPSCGYPSSTSTCRILRRATWWTSEAILAALEGGTCTILQAYCSEYSFHVLRRIGAQSRTETAMTTK
jgi:hypothetical protein